MTDDAEREIDDPSSAGGSGPAADLLRLAEIYCGATGLTLRGLSKRVGHDKVFTAMAAGGKCRPRTAASLMAFFARSWPPGLAWPSDIVRPDAVPVETVEKEEAAMPIEFERDDEQLAEMIAEEKHDQEAERRLAFVERLRELEAQAAQDRMAEKSRIRDALETLEQADGMLLGEVEAENAVWGTPNEGLRSPPGPSAAGQTPHNADLLARQEASAERTAANDRAQRARWLEAQSQEGVVEALCGGQEPTQQAAIRAAFRVQRGN